MPHIPPFPLFHTIFPLFTLSSPHSFAPPPLPLLVVSVLCVFVPESSSSSLLLFFYFYFYFYHKETQCETRPQLCHADPVYSHLECSPRFAFRFNRFNPALPQATSTPAPSHAPVAVGGVTAVHQSSSCLRIMHSISSCWIRSRRST